MYTHQYVASWCSLPRTDDVLERTAVQVTLQQVDQTALRLLVDYAYTGEVAITEDNVQVGVDECQVNCTDSRLFKTYKLREANSVT